MTGFYKVLKSDAPPDAVGGSFDVFAFYQDDEAFWLHSAIYPHPLEGIVPAEVIGTSWQAVWDSLAPEIRDSVFFARVRREGTIIRVLRNEIQEGDEVLRAALVPHRFVGERLEEIVVEE